MQKTISPVAGATSTLDKTYLLADGKWSLDQIKANPDEVMRILKNQCAGEELLMKIGGIGHYLTMYGSMDDLHNFMCATTNPTATSNMAAFLVSMAKTREDALKLLTYTSFWVGQAEERAVNDILLRKAGSILGATALDMLNERSAQGQPQEFSELISGIAEKDPVAVQSWLELNRSSLSQDAVSRMLFQISSNTNSTDLLSNENIRLLRGPMIKFKTNI